MVMDKHNGYGNHNAVFADVALFFKEDAPTYHKKGQDNEQTTGTI